MRTCTSGVAILGENRSETVTGGELHATLPNPHMGHAFAVASTTTGIGKPAYSPCQARRGTCERLHRINEQQFRNTLGRQRGWAHLARPPIFSPSISRQILGVRQIHRAASKTRGGRWPSIRNRPKCGLQGGCSRPDFRRILWSLHHELGFQPDDNLR